MSRLLIEQSVRKIAQNTQRTIRKKSIPESKEKVLKPCGFRTFVAAGEGFEPSHTESESAVLPLHKPAIFVRSCRTNRYYYIGKQEFVKGFFEFCRKSFCTVNGQGRFSQKGTASHSRMKSAVVDGIKSLFLFCLTEELSRRNFLRRMAGHRAKRGSTKKHRQSRCSFSGVRYGTRTHGLQGHNLTR